MVGLSKLNEKVYADEESQLLVVTEADPSNVGFDAYRYANYQGDVWVLVPSLNFFPIMRQSVLSGRREVYFNIKVGMEPLPTLFELPAGAVLVPADAGDSAPIPMK